MDKQNENHSASKNPILSSLLDSQKVNDNRKRSNQEEHEDESEEYVQNMHPTVSNRYFLVRKMKILWMNQLNHQKRKNLKKKKEREKIFEKLLTMKNLMNERKKPEPLKRNVSNVFYSGNKGTILRKFRLNFGNFMIIFLKFFD